MQTLISKFFRIAGIGAALGLTLMATACSKAPATAASTADMTMGDPNAKVTVTEYASVACPICARVNASVMPIFKAKYVDTGKVKYVYRPMMTGNAAVATAGHLLAQCAGKDKFFKVIDAVMRSQDEMGGETTGYENARPVLQGIAKSVGLTDDQFNTCIQDPKGIKALNDINDAALNANIDSTPTFQVNGKTMELQKGDITDFDAAIQPLLKK